MVSSCSNPACHTELKFLNAGNLYAFERRSSVTEFFWLCADCVPLVALFLDPMGSVSVTPRPDPGRPQPPHPDGDLRLVAASAEGQPWRWEPTLSDDSKRNLPFLSINAA
jgi:hypothetical protein